jgi:hypothetical protein
MFGCQDVVEQCSFPCPEIACIISKILCEDVTVLPVMIVMGTFVELVAVSASGILVVSRSIGGSSSPPTPSIMQYAEFQLANKVNDSVVLVAATTL